MIAMEHMIQARHPLPEWATFGEFSNATGSGATGRIDVAAFNVWPSKKGHRVAYEVKRSRSDFLRELNNPEKRAWVEELFHETYFVAEKGVCEPGEIPEGWGLLVVVGKDGDKLRRKVVPKYRDVPDPPYNFVMSLLRRSCADLSSEMSRQFRFDGEEITTKQLEKMANEKLTYFHEILAKRQTQAEEIRNQLVKDQARLIAPLATLQKLGSGLPSWQSQWSPGDEVTAETVRGWWKDMQNRAAESVRVQLVEARNRLNSLLQTLEQENA